MADLTHGAKHITSGLCREDCVNRGHACKYCFKIKGKMTNYLTKEELPEPETNV